MELFELLISIRLLLFPLSPSQIGKSDLHFVG
jgi:hypothetical protein